MISKLEICGHWGGQCVYQEVRSVAANLESYSPGWDFAFILWSK